mgnify:FL=1
MANNASAKFWTTTIEILDDDGNTISGPHNYTGAEGQVQDSFPELNTQSPDGYKAWTGSLTLLTGISAFSLDNRDISASPTGASLLAEGNRVDLKIFDGASFVREWPPLYILLTPDP